MKIGLQAALLVTALMFSQGTAARLFETTEELMEKCKAVGDVEDAIEKKGSDLETWTSIAQFATCVGYTRGWLDSYFFQQTLKGEKPMRFGCIPQETNLKQIVNVFLKYAQEHPELHHEQPMGVLSVTMREAFPCPK